MREILFRGKTNSGKWVYGSLVHRTMFYGDPCDDYVILSDGEFHCDYYDADEVITETIGQFTGLTDETGAKIFEGDVISGNGKTGYVNYDFGCFCVHEMGHSKNNPAIDVVMFHNAVKVIGNIHDNQELLEV